MNEFVVLFTPVFKISIKRVVVFIVLNAKLGHIIESGMFFPVDIITFVSIHVSLQGTCWPTIKFCGQGRSFHWNAWIFSPYFIVCRSDCLTSDCRVLIGYSSSCSIFLRSDHIFIKFIINLSSSLLESNNIFFILYSYEGLFESLSIRFKFFLLLKVNNRATISQSRLLLSDNDLLSDIVGISVEHNVFFFKKVTALGFENRIILENVF